MRGSDDIIVDNYFIDGARQGVMVSWVTKELRNKKDFMDDGGLICDNMY